MKKLFIKSTNWVLAGIMGLFGFTGGLVISCPEYGMPHADYTVKGSVVNEATGKPIPGIRLGFSPAEWDEEAFGPKPEDYYWKSNVYVKTNINGGFTLTDFMFPLRSNNPILPVYAEDIDGEVNGLLQAKKVDVDFKNAVLIKKPKSWYKGGYTVTTTIKLVEVEIE